MQLESVTKSVAEGKSITTVTSVAVSASEKEPVGVHAVTNDASEGKSAILVI